MNRPHLLLYFMFTLLNGCLQETKHERTNGVSSLYPIREFGKWGYISAEGKTIIECQFDMAREFSEELAAVMVDSLWGFIDPTGKMVIPSGFYEAYIFSDGLCNVYIKTDSGIKNIFIKPDGSIAFTSRDNFISSFSGGVATGKIDDEVCIIDKSGEIIVNTHYPYGGSYPPKDGIVKVWNGDSTKYFDVTGKLLLQLDGMAFSDFDKGLALVRIKDEACYINIKGEIKIKPERPELTYFPFSEGLAEVVIPGDQTFGFIDTTGRIAVPIKFDLVNEFHGGLAAFMDKDVWGFMDKTGRTVIEPKFEQVGDFSHELCYVVYQNRAGYINANGEFVWREPVNSIR
jgi:hypothetical protein